MPFDAANLLPILPEIAILVTASVVLILDLYLKPGQGHQPYADPDRPRGRHRPDLGRRRRRALRSSSTATSFATS
jgi:hypothetical protein